jgi:hypothetical protein
MTSHRNTLTLGAFAGIKESRVFNTKTTKEENLL